MTWSNQAPNSITIPPGATSNYIVIDQKGITGYDTSDVKVLQITPVGANGPEITVGNIGYGPTLALYQGQGSARIEMDFPTPSGSTIVYNPGYISGIIQSPGTVNQLAEFQISGPTNSGHTSTPAIISITSEIGGGFITSIVLGAAKELVVYPQNGTQSSKVSINTVDFTVGSTKMAFGASATAGMHYFEEQPLNSAQNVPNSNATIVIFTTTGFIENDYSQYNSQFNSLGNTWTCPGDGVYTIHCSLEFATWPASSINTGFDLSLWAKLQSYSNTWMRTTSDDAPRGSGHGFVTVTRKFLAGDLVQIKIFQNSGASQGLDNTQEKSFFTAYRHV